jgi:type II secretory pathway component PulC
MLLPCTEANNEGPMRVSKHINLINCILIMVSLIFAYQYLFPRMNTDVAFTVHPLVKKPAEKNPYELSKPQTLSPQEYRTIADQNLFHPERIIPPEKKPEAILPKPEFVLYGTLITPDLKMAYLEDKKAPVTTPGRGQRQSALKIGESLSGFRVKEIMTDKVVMTRGEETLQVLLQEPGSSKTRETTISGPGSRIPVPGMVPGAVPGAVPGISTPSPTPSIPPPGRTVPLAPGQRPIPSGRMQVFPAPQQQGAPTPSSNQ